MIVDIQTTYRTVRDQRKLLISWEIGNLTTEGDLLLDADIYKLMKSNKFKDLRDFVLEALSSNPEDLNKLYLENINILHKALLGKYPIEDFPEKWI